MRSHQWPVAIVPAIPIRQSTLVAGAGDVTLSNLRIDILFGGNRDGITGASTREALVLFACRVFLAVTVFAGKSIVRASSVLGFGS